MPIEAIEKKLQQWGEWSVRRECNGLGYKTVSLARLMGIPASTIINIPMSIEEDMMKIERTVCYLPVYLRETIIEVYQRNGLMKEHARRLGINESTLWRRIEGAHALIRNALWERKF